MQGSVASFHFRNELSLSEEGDLLGEGEGGPGSDPGLGRQASGPVGRQTSLAQAARLHVAVEVTWAECVCASI